MPKSLPDALALPLRPADLFVLLVLDEQDLHGYGVMKAVERLSSGDVRIDIGSLYRVIARMTDAALVEAVADAAAGRDVVDERRRYYRITPMGRRTLKAELARLKEVVAIGSARGLLGTRGKTR